MKYLLTSAVFGNIFSRAEVAQLVEHNLAKVGVAGSNPVFRSSDTTRDRFLGLKSTEPVSFLLHNTLWRCGQVVRQRPAKPLSPVQIRASPPENLKTPLLGSLFYF